MFDRIEILLGDITRVKADAIVNAANNSLLGGGGVDGAIHKAAGPGLLDECRKIGQCKTGRAVMTGGYQLPSPHVIHAVGPKWRGGSSNEEALLAYAYQSALNLAVENQLASVAFPNISTGVYGFPKEAAASIAILTVINHIDNHQWPSKVTFVCFDQENFDLYKKMLAGL